MDFIYLHAFVLLQDIWVYYNDRLQYCWLGSKRRLSNENTNAETTTYVTESLIITQEYLHNLSRKSSNQYWHVSIVLTTTSSKTLEAAVLLANTTKLTRPLGSTSHSHAPKSYDHQITALAVGKYSFVILFCYYHKCTQISFSPAENQMLNQPAKTS